MEEKNKDGVKKEENFDETKTEVFDSEEGKELKKQWGVPDEYIGVGHCVLGYRDCEYPAAKPRKEGFVIRV